ncbi:MAG TPA: AarF/UbiB family protein [Opitutaceae bacterium]|nr:AarF/UbiB family protein [Opitutaceae bacterium]
MKLSSAHLKRYQQIAALLWKYGRSDLVQKIKTTEGFEDPDYHPTDSAVQPEQLVDDLEAMGPTYVKLGQVLAGRPDLLPEPYLVALERLHDRVKPFPYEEVEKIVATELGVRISKAFSRFDVEPLAAASLGQVHTAALRDGREVVVKVQRPEIRHQIAEDFEVLADIASMLDEHTELGRRYRFSKVLDEFRATIQDELNYEREARNLITVAKNLEEYPLIKIPEPILDYTTSRVLTMERIRGRKVTSLEPIARLDFKGGELAEEIFKAYLKQVLVDGVFHADPHPGNVFVTEDYRVALLDLGMVGHMPPGMQENLLKLLMAVSEGRTEEAADIVVMISQRHEDFNGTEFRRRISQLITGRQNEGLQQLEVGEALLSLSRDARETGIMVPSELTLLGKTLLQLDEVGRTLDPEFDPNASVRRNVGALMTRRMKKNLTQGNVFRSVLEMKEFTTQLPSRLNRIMDAVTNAEVEVRVKAVDAKTMLDGMQKIANRITAGVVTAALIIGAALLMRVQTSFSILGYPGFAMLCFLVAAASGVWLLISIFVQDERSKKEIVHSGGK